MKLAKVLIFISLLGLYCSAQAAKCKIDETASAEFDCIFEDQGIVNSGTIFGTNISLTIHQIWIEFIGVPKNITLESAQNSAEKICAEFGEQDFNNLSDKLKYNYSLKVYFEQNQKGEPGHDPFEGIVNQPGWGFLAIYVCDIRIDRTPK